jgi:poly-gamma-glutamate synthesis protein (capsule biosynthesis protein)
LNDYEGIGGYEWFRSELTLMYFPQFDAATGALTQLALTPMRIRNFRLNRAHADDVLWIMKTLMREGRSLGTSVERQTDDTLVLRWNSA